ncbi:MAG TPA: XRE family transcriptional regulator [Actinoplanes sp.]|nr:XRE family transcriptional regulator [Actinoplanes sp.]
MRKSHWSDVSITQAQLAEALEQRKSTSVQLISSWERTSNPTPPPEDRLNAIATFFSTRRSLEGGRFRLVNETDLTTAEAGVRERLLQELHSLRRAALAELGATWPTVDGPAPTIVGRGPWHFHDDGPVIIVCAELPDDLQETMPGSALPAPDRSELSRFADLDSLFELHGHIRAVNPDHEVQYRSADRMRRDDWTAHLVLLGGVDWNKATQDTMRLTGVPLRQYSDDADPSRGCFRVVGTGDEESFAPEFEDRGTGRVLVQDVGHFLRAPNPLNRTRTVTVCNGMYGSGVFGSVRTLTDKVLRERNADYLAETFGGDNTFSLLFRVQIGNGVVVTPDWTARGTVLHTWSEAGS